MPRGRRREPARRRRVPPPSHRGRPRADDDRADHLQRRHRAGARGGAGRGVRPVDLRVRQPDDAQARHGRPRRPADPEVRRLGHLGGARRVQGPRVQVRDPGRRDDLKERRDHPAEQGRDPEGLRGSGRGDPGPVRHGPDHPGGAPRAGGRALDGLHRRGRQRHAGELRPPQPDLHDGQLGSARIVQPDPPARRDARADGQPEGRDHRAADQVQLHGGPDRARVLHLDARCPQGTGRHRAAHRRLGLPDAPSRRRRPGRDHP